MLSLRIINQHRHTYQGFIWAKTLGKGGGAYPAGLHADKLPAYLISTGEVKLWHVGTEAAIGQVLGGQVAWRNWVLKKWHVRKNSLLAILK